MQEYQNNREMPDFGMGNIDLNHRPVIHNADGTDSTVYSMSFNVDGKEVLVPTVRFGLDRIMSPQEALDWYKKTGEYLGIFNTPEEATEYAEKVHQGQMQKFGGLKPVAQEAIRRNK